MCENRLLQCFCREPLKSGLTVSAKLQGAAFGLLPLDAVDTPRPEDHLGPSDPPGPATTRRDRAPGG